MSTLTKKKTAYTFLQLRFVTVVGTSSLIIAHNHIGGVITKRRKKRTLCRGQGTEGRTTRFDVCRILAYGMMGLWYTNVHFFLDQECCVFILIPHQEK